MLIVNADLSRQFEFVQQQWINYGNDFGCHDPDPLLGNHGTNEGRRGGGRMTIEGDVATNRPPYFCDRMPPRRDRAAITSSFRALPAFA